METLSIVCLLCLCTEQRSEILFTGCWITDNYQLERIALEYFWLWLAAFFNILIYVFLALVIKGIVVVENGRICLRRGYERTTSRFTSGIGTQMLLSVIDIAILDENTNTST